MRVAVVSDTHGNWPFAVQAIQQEGDVNYLIFLGDNASDGKQMERALQIPSYIVCGNCDYEDEAPEEQLLELGDWRFLICHGHRYGVKRNLQQIYYRGLELQVDFVLFGHTHQAIYAEEGVLTLLNPGSLSSRNLASNTASWGLLTLSEKKDENFLKKYEKKLAKLSRI